MKPVFNSLGTNYDLSDVILALTSFLSPNKNKIKDLADELNSYFGTKNSTFLFYKGRDAIEFSLKAANLGQGDLVMTQAFACHAIEQAIVRAGAEPVYVDVDEDSTNLSAKTLQNALKSIKNQKAAKAVLVQHSLGIPADIKEISDWCHKNDIILIEDLAQGFGGVADNGAKLGSFGDFTICSFGRDKIIDSVTGGAATINNKKYLSVGQEIYKSLNTFSGWMQKVRNAKYPLVTYLIRNTYQLGFGKITFGRILNILAQLSGLISSPTKSVTSKMTKLPASTAELALKSLRSQQAQISHRRLIAKFYQSELSSLKGKDIRFITSLDQIDRGSCLRFPVLIKNPDEKLKKLTKKSIYLTDRWYRSPVDSGKLNLPTLYKRGSAPRAEKLSEQVINLPTHLGITKNIAKEIITNL